MVSTPEIEKLAAEIGENIYIDVANWHLYLADAHLHTVLAEKVYPALEEKSISASVIKQVLQGISVPIGGDRRSLPLSDLISPKGQADLLRLLEDYQDQW